MLRLTREQSRRVDRIAVEHFAIPSIVLMENAARGIFDVASAMLGSARGRRVVCLCGAGNNGGDGLAVARHLHNHGADVLIALAADPGRYAGDALIQWTITRRIGIAAQPATPELLAEETDLIIDAIFGTGLTSAPREPFPQLVAALDASRHRVLAVDLPSGMDADTGLPLGPCIRAAATVTMVAEKAAFAHAHARPYTGPITIADIGCPQAAVLMAVAT